MNPAYEVLDKAFLELIDPTALLVTLWSGTDFGEGPAWFPAARSLVWSDITSDRLLRYDECTGAVGTFRAPSGFANGNTVDREGRLLTCEGGGRRVSRTEHDGTITVVADRYRGKRLNSPNDVVVKSDGSVWFTDPSYGIDEAKFGGGGPAEIGGQNVYRVDPHNGEVTLVCDDFVQPNGLAFSPDERLLYIVETGGTHVKDLPFTMRVYDVSADGRRLSKGRLFATCSPGVFDGFRLDEHGNVWTSGGKGVHCYRPDGAWIGSIRIDGQQVTNLVFGGPSRRRLFITGLRSLFAVDVAVSGARTI
jgi:gluconolactonase